MTAREPLPQTAEEAAERVRFLRRYGPWEPMGPPGLAAFMAGFPRPWWIVGGWSIDAFTDHPREHADIDLSILACDIPALRAHVGDRWHLWSSYAGMLRPLDDRSPDVLSVLGQIWVREHAQAPWVLDLPITPDRDGAWTNKRLPGQVLPLQEATWVAGDGLRYLRPEISLLYKARLRRPKDERDLALSWPLLDPGARSWLLGAVARTEGPGHPWLARLRQPD